jgi:hypothetical protein
MDSFRDQLRALVELFGSARRAADFLGASPSQLRSWLDTAVPSDRNLRKIVDGVAVIDGLRRQGLDDAQLLTMITSIWPELRARPVDLVREGSSAEVLAAVAARYEPAAAPEEPAMIPELVDALLALAAAATSSATMLSRGAA